MDYEKKYKDALELAKSYYGDGNMFLDTIFPELKESEDERIRKWLYNLIDRMSFEEDNEPFRKSVLAWIEKQKEQKPESCDCSRDEESYINGIHHVLMNPEAYGLIKQKPAEWSEEDEKMLNVIIGNYRDNDLPAFESDRKDVISWLKSLRSRPKSSDNWKPSEEQPEVDLEKEAKRWWKEHLHLNPENKLWMDAHQSVVFARHFYELARLKYEK